MINKIYILLCVVCLFTFISCNSEDKLEPKLDYYELQLANGNHDYDSVIKKWNERTGIYILYKFNPSDVYFNVSDEWAEYHADTLVNNSWYKFNDEVYLNTKSDSVHVNGTWHPLNVKIYDEYGEFWGLYTVQENMVRYQQQEMVTRGSIKVDLPDENYVGRQLTYVENKFLKFYPDSILRKYAPLKIILGANLIQSYMRHGYKVTRKVDYLQSFNNLMFSHGDKTVDKMSKISVTDLNKTFILKNFDSRLNKDEFFSYSRYTVDYPDDVLILKGLLDHNSTVADASVNKAADWSNYFNMILNYSFSTLTADPDVDAGYWNLKGILNPKRDIRGLVMTKYRAMIAAYKKVGIDLQAIGNESGN
jgi:hypothetical protein